MKVVSVSLCVFSCTASVIVGPALFLNLIGIDYDDSRQKGNLKTLFNLGTEIKDLRKIFLLQGTLLSVFGGYWLALGIIIVLLQQHFQLVMITPTLAYPVVFTLENVLIVMGTIVTLGFIASWIAVAA
jgi:ABC-type lipoprotein release transport system permease subunit